MRQEADLATTLALFEGLVFRTSQMYAARTGFEPEELEQELRIVVVRCVQRYDSTRSALPLRNYVFQAITNKIKDFKRDATRRARYGLAFIHIEDLRLPGAGGAEQLHDGSTTQEEFDAIWNRAEADQVYGRVDNRYELPPTVTEFERQVLMLVIATCTKGEIATLLDASHKSVDEAIRSLREKLAVLRT